MFIAEDIIKVDNTYYFAAKDINAICSFDEDEKFIHILYTDISESIWGFRRYGRVFRYENILIFTPLWADTFLIYYIIENRFETINVKKIDNYGFDYFFSGAVIGNRLILAGCQYPAIVVINIETLKTEYYDKPFDELLEIHRKNDDCFFRNDMVVINNSVYIASCITNRVLEFSTDDGHYKWHEIGDIRNKYSGLAWDGEKIWLAPRRETKFVSWNPNSNEIEEFEIQGMEVHDEDKDKCSFLGVVYDGKNIICPGMQIDNTVIIDPKTCKTKLISKSYIFYTHKDGLNYALRKDGILEVFVPGEYDRPKKIIETQNDNTIIATLIHESGEKIFEGYKGIQLKDFVDMVSI